MLTKYKDNTKIKELAESNPKFAKPFLWKIRDILKGESDPKLRELTEEEANDIELFTTEEGIILDKVADKLRQCGEHLSGVHSVDIVTILDENVALLADAKINLVSYKNIAAKDAKELKGKYDDSIRVLKDYTSYSLMELTPHNKLVVILPNERFELIYAKLRECNLNKPDLQILKIKDFYSTFFASP